MQVLCNRGCGGVIDVDDEMVANMVALKQRLEFAHEDCDGRLGAPREGEAEHRYRVQVLIYELEDGAELGPAHFTSRVPSADLCGGIGATVTATSYPRAVQGPINEWFHTRSVPDGTELITPWEQLRRASVLDDLPVRTPEARALTADEQVAEEDPVVPGRRPSGLVIPGR